MVYPKGRGRGRGPSTYDLPVLGEHGQNLDGDDDTPANQGTTAGYVDACDDVVHTNITDKGTTDVAGHNNTGTSADADNAGTSAGADPVTPSGFTPDPDTFWTDHLSRTPAAAVPGETVPGVATAPKLAQIREEGPDTLPGAGPQPRALASSFDTPAAVDQGMLEAAARTAMIRDIVRECVKETNTYIHVEIERHEQQAVIAAADTWEQQARTQAMYA
jgi:hypothetical protein